MEQPKTYVDVGFEAGLKGRHLLRFVEYMKIRWGKEEYSQCSTGYAKEWAERFVSGNDYGASDIHGQRILLNIDKAWLKQVEDQDLDKLEASLKEIYP